MMLDARARSSAGFPLSALLLVCACGDGPRASEGDTDSTTSITGVSQTTTSTTLDPTDTESTSTSGVSETETSGDATTGEDVCETAQCGTECCAEGQECVLGACLDACESEVRCGDDLTVCCSEGQVCLQPDCITPGDPCIDSFDCPIGEFCEPTVGLCLPQQDPVACEVLPTFEEVQLALEWSWEEGQVSTTPVVGDIDGDGLPEVIIGSFDHPAAGSDPGGFNTGVVRIFEGESGVLKAEIPHNPPTSYGISGYGSIGLADVDGNNLPDIIYPSRLDGNSQSRIVAVTGLGQLIWASTNSTGASAASLYVRNGAPSFANFDSDSAAEIVFGGAILDNTGRIVWDGGETITTPEGTGPGLGALLGSNTHAGAGLTPTEQRRGYGGITAIADVTGNSTPELFTGRYAFSVSWTAGFPNPNVVVTQLWDAGDPDGWPAIGDINMDGDPDVVIVAGGTVRVVRADNGNLIAGPIDIPDTADPVGRGGPPTIADFDGDGRPEIAAAAAEVYTVFDMNRPGEEVVTPGGFPNPAANALFVRWLSPTRDVSSNGTGSSVFDFQGDGSAEVLYGDECYFRVYDGSTGNVISEIESSSITNREYPIVVDLDADGNSEIVVVANNYDIARCVDDIPAYGTGKRGLFVYGDPNDEWVRTRRVWSSHTYHVTNSDSIGHIPATEENNWEQEGLNNYRQNVQGPGVFNAPDLSVDVSVGLGTCLDEQFEIIATVRNEGSLGVPAGIEVNLYEGTDATGTLIGPALTTNPLLPGGFEQLTWLVDAPGGEAKDFFVAIDGVDTETSAITECNEDNNTAATVTVACPNQG